MSITEGTSSVTWSVSGLDGVSVNQDGVVTYSDRTPTGTFMVSVESEYGQTETKSISIINEVEGIISGNNMLAAKAGAANSTTMTCNLEGTWSISGDVPDGVSLEINQNGKITLSSAETVEAFTAEVVLTTLGGQVIVKEMTFKVINTLVFNNNPTNGVIAYEV
jgi:nitrate reductase NapAB chaperone NapD